MKARTLALLGLALPLAAGCRVDPRIPPLEQELRLQQDRIYELEDQVARYKRELAACQGQPAAAGPAILQPAVTQPSLTRPATGPTPAGAQSKPSAASPSKQGRPTAPSPGAPSRLKVPKVEMPAKPTPPGYVPPRLRTPSATKPSSGANAPQSMLPPSDENGPIGRTTWRTGTASRQVASITLNGLFTGGYDADGQPGDEGIAASIEPRDAQGRLVAAAAPVSVVLLDPAEPGQSARFARWDFSAEEIAAMARTAQGTEGIHLAMDWPGKPPAHRRLRLFVRYTTDDGRKLEASQEIDVNVPGERQARRWIPVPPSAQPAEPTRAAASPAPAAPRADPAPARSWSPAPQAAQAPAVPARAATRPAPPPAEPSEPSEPAAPPRQRPTWSPYR